MTRRQIAVFACKILAIFAFIQAITFTQVVVFQVGAATELPGISRGFATLSAIAPVVLLISFALFLWLASENIASYMITGDNEENEIVTGKDFKVIGFSTLGLFILSRSLPEFTGNILNYFLIEKQLPFNEGVNIRYLIQIWVKFLEMTIGFGLFFGAGGLAGMVKEFRAADQKEGKAVKGPE